MSSWTYVRGMIIVDPIGESTTEKEFVVHTVLDHLPPVTGSEKNMCVYVTPSAYYGLNYRRNSEYGYKSGRAAPHFLITIEGDLRDRKFDQTRDEVMRWICRLGKRLFITDICLSIRDEYGRKGVLTDERPLLDIYEGPHWIVKYGKPKWLKQLEKEVQVQCRKTCGVRLADLNTKDPGECGIC